MKHSDNTVSKQTHTVQVSHMSLPVYSHSENSAGARHQCTLEQWCINATNCIDCIMVAGGRKLNDVLFPNEVLFGDGEKVKEAANSILTCFPLSFSSNSQPSAFVTPTQRQVAWRAITHHILLEEGQEVFSNTVEWTMSPQHCVCVRTCIYAHFLLACTHKCPSVWPWWQSCRTPVKEIGGRGVWVSEPKGKVRKVTLGGRMDDPWYHL